MPFLTPEELAALHVEDLIFHVVGKTEADLVLMDEVAEGGADVAHRNWFLERLRATNGGNVFDFISPSAVRDALLAIEQDPRTFSAQSQLLAQAFQNTHTGATSKGVLLVMRLSCMGRTLHAMMKYDHEEALSFLTAKSGKRTRAEMQRIFNTFVEKAEAIQKSCIIRLNETGGEMCVRDRSRRRDISDYFRSFLAVRRRHDGAALTQKVVNAAKAAVTSVADELPPGVRENVVQRIYEAVQQTKGFDPEDPIPFLTAIVGPLPEDSPLPRAFSRELRKERIEEEAFDFVKGAIRRPTRRRITTHEGIQIKYSTEDEGLIETREHGGRTIITINTARITERDDDPDQPRERGDRFSATRRQPPERDPGPR